MPPPLPPPLLLLLLFPLLVSAQRTFDVCTPDESCRGTRTCQSFAQAPCDSDTDPVCFCQPPTLTPCATSSDCLPTETCVQDIQFRLFCADITAQSRLSIIAPAPPLPRLPPANPGPIFSDCNNPLDPRQCAPATTCLNLFTLQPCAGERNCACIGNEITFCLRTDDCPPPLTCVQSPILTLPFCVPPPATNRWLAITEVTNTAADGYTLDPCRTNRDCRNPRLCRVFDQPSTPCTPGVGAPCACMPPRPRRTNSCQATADCRDRREVCATSSLLPALGPQCVAIAARDAYEFVSQVDSTDTCPVLIPQQRPGGVVRGVVGVGGGERGGGWMLPRVGRITGGRLANRELQFSMVVMRTAEGGVCGGVLISKRWVLSAAHCGLAAGTDVAFGPRRLDLDDGMFDATLVRVFNHPLWGTGSRTDLNDLAVAELSEDAPRRMRPLRVNTVEGRGRAGEPVRAVGYGEVSGTGVADKRAVLRQVDLRVVGRRECTAANQRLVVPMAIRGPLQICVRSERERCGPCFGDSGGPLLAYRGGEPVIIGITTAAVMCDTLLFPALYTRVSGFIGFLRNTGADFKTSGSGRRSGAGVAA